MWFLYDFINRFKLFIRNKFIRRQIRFRERSILNFQVTVYISIRGIVDLKGLEFKSAQIPLELASSKIEVGSFDAHVFQYIFAERRCSRMKVDELAFETSNLCFYEELQLYCHLMSSTFVVERDC